MRMTLIELIKFTDIDSFTHDVPHRSKVYTVVILRLAVDGESGDSGRKVRRLSGSKRSHNVMGKLKILKTFLKFRNSMLIKSPSR